MKTAAVIGASGYAAGELFRLLESHPKFKPAAAFDVKNVGREVGQIHPNLRNIVKLKVEEPDYDEISSSYDVVFVATPHGVAMKFVPKILEGGAKVIDLSADYRFDDPKVFEKYYIPHESPETKGVYGLPELYREQVKKAKLIANPGCYPTATILGLAPLVEENLIDPDHIVIDAKSGTSGAGVTPSETLHHPTAAASHRPYAATVHRHEPEITQELSKIAKKNVRVHFTPHLLPMVRGMLCTMHVFLNDLNSKKDLLTLYKTYYKDEKFVRVLDEMPHTGAVAGSNYCDIGIEAAKEGNRVVVASAIDNLLKGASGQAIQNMNLMFGLKETAGLDSAGPHP